MTPSRPVPVQTWTIVFASLPETLAALKALPGAALTEPQQTAALCAAALCAYETSPENAIAMLDYLKGPQPLSPYEKQFLADRLRGKGYVPRSYFAGAVPETNYVPTRPYTITVQKLANAEAQAAEGYLQLSLQSGGADSPRPVKLRQKPSTGQWFLWEQMLLSDIRPPVSKNAWA